MKVLAVLAAVPLLLGPAACGSSDHSVDGAEGGGASASCAFVVEYAGARYLGTGDDLVPATATTPAGVPTLGDPLGTATLLGCDDGGGAVDDVHGTAYAVAGVDPRWAIAFGGGREDEVLCLVHGPRIPADVLGHLRFSPGPPPAE